MTIDVSGERKANSILGQLGEILAADHLRTLGYEILRRNYRHGRGEVDLIARDGDALAFIEVKTRASDEFGHPLEGFSMRQRGRIAQAAYGFMREAKPACREYRFDTVAVLMREGGQAEIELFKNAFYLGEFS